MFFYPPCAISFPFSILTSFFHIFIVLFYFQYICLYSTFSHCIYILYHLCLSFHSKHLFGMCLSSTLILLSYLPLVFLWISLYFSAHGIIISFALIWVCTLDDTYPKLHFAWVEFFFPHFNVRAYSLPNCCCTCLVPILSENCFARSFLTILGGNTPKESPGKAEALRLSIQIR